MNLTHHRSVAVTLLVTLACLALAPAEPAAALNAVSAPEPGDPRVRPGYWNKGKVPEGWIVVETDHYQIQCQAGVEKAEQLGEHLERMLDFYKETLPFHRKIKTFILKIFKDRGEYLSYGAPPSSAAYYSKSSKELVAYDTGIIAGTRDIDDFTLNDTFDTEVTDAQLMRILELLERATDEHTMDLAGILAHEGWHQYFHHYTVSWVAMPSWIDEGVGDYFFSATYDEQFGGVRVGSLNDGRLRRVRDAIEDDAAVPIGDLVFFEQKDYYANASVFYAQGWALVYFLMHHENEDYRELIPKYIKRFKDTKSIKKTNKLLFKRIDFEELDAEWRRWVAELPVQDPVMELAQEFGAIVPSTALVGHDEFATARIQSTFRSRLARLAQRAAAEAEPDVGDGDDGERDDRGRR